MASPPQVSKGNCFRFRYNEHADTANDTRNVLLIVATVIIAVTFQAGVNPPGGVWQDDKNGTFQAGVNPPGGVWQDDKNGTFQAGVNPPGGVGQDDKNGTFQAGVNPPGGVGQDDKNGHQAGRAIYASKSVPFHIFLSSNTLALSSSILILLSLTYKFPFYLELWAAILGMFATYASAIFAISPDESVRFGTLLGAAAVPFLFRFLIHIYKML